MAGTTGYPLLQIVGIRAIMQHLLIVIGFYYEIVGFGNHGFHVISDMPHIGHEDECHVRATDTIPHIIHAVVRHMEGCHLKMVYNERLTIFDIMFVFGHQLTLYTIVAVNAGMYVLGRMHHQFKVMAETAHRLYVVGMVMGYQ